MPPHSSRWAPAARQILSPVFQTRCSCIGLWLISQLSRLALRWHLRASHCSGQKQQRETTAGRVIGTTRRRLCHWLRRGRHRRKARDLNVTARTNSSWPPSSLHQRTEQSSRRSRTKGPPRARTLKTMRGCGGSISLRG